MTPFPLKMDEVASPSPDRWKIHDWMAGGSHIFLFCSVREGEDCVCPSITSQWEA